MAGITILMTLMSIGVSELRDTLWWDLHSVEFSVCHPESRRSYSDDCYDQQMAAYADPDCCKVSGCFIRPHDVAAGNTS